MSTVFQADTPIDGMGQIWKMCLKLRALARREPSVQESEAAVCFRWMKQWTGAFTDGIRATTVENSGP